MADCVYDAIWSKPLGGPVCWSLEGFLVASDDQGFVHRLDPTSGEPAGRIQVAEGRPLDLDLAAGGTRLAVVPQAGDVRIVDGQSGEEIHAFEVEAASSLAFSPNGEQIAIAGNEGLSWWDVSSGEQVDALDDHGRFGRVAWSPGGDQLAASRNGTELVLIDLASKRVRSHQFDSAVRDLVWSPNGNRVLVASTKVASVAPRARLEDFTQLQGSVDDCRAVGWGPDVGRFAAGGHDGLVEIWDARDDVVVGRLRPHDASITHLAWSPDGKWLASVSGRKTVTVSNLMVGSGRARTEVRSLAWADEGLAAGTDDGRLRIWAPQASIADDFVLGDQAVASLAWAPSGTDLAACVGKRTTVVCPRKRQMVLRVDSEMDRMTAAAWSPDGSRLVAVRGRAAPVWSLPPTALPDGTPPLLGVVCYASGSAFRSGGIVTTYARLWSVSWSPDGAALATGSDRGAVMIWPSDASLLSRARGGDLKPIGTYRGPVKDSVFASSKPVTAVAWSPVGGRLAAVVETRPDTPDPCDVCVWSVGTDEPAWTQRISEGLVRAISWSGDGTRLAVATAGGATKIVDGESGQVLRELPSHGGGIWALAWAPDDSALATGGDDGRIVVWLASTGRAIRALDVQTGRAELVEGPPPPPGEVTVSSTGGPDTTSTVAGPRWSPVLEAVLLALLPGLLVAGTVLGLAAYGRQAPVAACEQARVAASAGRLDKAEALLDAAIASSSSGETCVLNGLAAISTTRCQSYNDLAAAGIDDGVATEIQAELATALHVPDGCPAAGVEPRKLDPDELRGVTDATDLRQQVQDGTDRLLTQLGFEFSFGPWAGALAVALLVVVYGAWVRFVRRWDPGVVRIQGFSDPAGEDDPVGAAAFRRHLAIQSSDLGLGLPCVGDVDEPASPEIDIANFDTSPVTVLATLVALARQRPEFRVSCAAVDEHRLSLDVDGATTLGPVTVGSSTLARPYAAVEAAQKVRWVAIERLRGNHGFRRAPTEEELRDLRTHDLRTLARLIEFGDVFAEPAPSAP